MKLVAIRLLGIDTSTKTGVAVLQVDKEKGVSLIHKEEINFPKLRGIQRADHIAATVGAIAKEHEVEQSVIENYGFSNAHTLVPLVEVGTMVRYVLHRLELSLLEVPPTSLKKFLTGKGNVKKDQMALHLYKRFGLEGSTDNEVDAISLALFGAAYHGYGTVLNLPKTHMDAVENVRNGKNK